MTMHPTKHKEDDYACTQRMNHTIIIAGDWPQAIAKGGIPT